MDQLPPYLNRAAISSPAFSPAISQTGEGYNGRGQKGLEISHFAGSGIDLEPGDTVQRSDLHDQYGGNRQKGISKTAEHDLIFVFLSERGPYTDWIGKRGHILYTGQGQRGDQEWTWENRYLRDHIEEGLEIHVFQADGQGKCEYRGEYKVLDYFEGKDVGNGRREIKFLLSPV